MNTSEWISRKVSKLLPVAASSESQAVRSAAPLNTDSRPVSRSTRERLAGTLRHKEEALSPRVLRRTLAELRSVVDGRVSEVEGGRRANGVALWYRAATVEQRRDCWLLMSEQFVADPQVVKLAQAQFAAAVGTPDEAAAEVHYRRATVSPRRRLLQRFSAFPDGIRFLVDLRAEMLPSSNSINAFRRWTSRWSTCSPPGLTSVFWICAASVGTPRHP